MTTNSASYLTQLHQLLNQHFNLAEIEDLCFRLHIDYESVPGDEKPSRIRELLLGLGRSGRLPELITLLKILRPYVDWPPVPDDFSLPISLTRSNITPLPEKQNKTLDAAIRKEIKVGESTIVLVLIRDPNSKGLRALLSIDSEYMLEEDDVRSSQVFQLYYPVDEQGNLLPTDVEIVVTAPDFIPPVESKIIEIDPNALDGSDLRPIEFMLTPTRVGELQIIVEVYQSPESVRKRMGAKPIRTTSKDNPSPFAKYRLVSLMFHTLGVPPQIVSTYLYGDNIQGDKFTGDKIGRDKNVVGDVSGQSAVAVGERAQATINRYGNIIIRADNFEDLPPAPGEPPYKGLAYFSTKDKIIFFGREKLSDELADRLQTTSFLAIMGASGSGKSSLLRAGIIPRLEERNWRIHIIKPGVHPLAALAASLTRDELDPATADTIGNALATNANTLHQTAEKLVARTHAERLLLAIDQFEELFTQCKDPQEQQAFVDNLVSAAQAQGAVTVLLSMRADFYGRVSQFHNLPDLISQEQVYIKPMAEEDLVRAIAEPAKRGGWQFVEGLVEQFVADVGKEPGHLPLLSHALLATWERRRGVVMTLGGYREAGGVKSAIAQTAEATYAALTASEQLIAKRIFLRLTELGKGTEDTRRRVNQLELGQDMVVQAVTQRLTAARLITTTQDGIDVAHEALIREWPRLREWLEADREGLIIHHRLTDAEQEWRNNGQEPSLLFSGFRLNEAEQWGKNNAEALNKLERAFLTASIAERQKHEKEIEAQRQRELEQAQALAEEQQQRANSQEAAAARFRKMTYWLVGLMSITIIIAVLALQATRQATARRMAADSRLLAEKGQLRLATLLAIESTNIENDNSTQIWQDVRTQNTAYREVGAISTLGSNAVRSVAWNPDGNHLASVSDDGTVDIWNIADNVELVTSLADHLFKSQESRVWSVAWHPDGDRLACASLDGIVYIWDATQHSPLTRLESASPQDHVASIAWNPDGNRLATVSTDINSGLSSIHIWDVTSGTELDIFEDRQESVTSVAWHPDGDRLAYASWDGTVRILNAASGAEVAALEGHQDAVHSVVWHPDGDRLASASWDGTVRIWDVASVTELTFLKAFVNSITWHPNSDILAASSNDAIYIWNTSDDTKPIVLTGGANSVAWHPDGNYLASGSNVDAVHIWEATRYPELTIFKGADDGSETTDGNVTWEPGGNYLATSNSETVRILDVANKVELANIAGAIEMAWHPDGDKQAFIFCEEWNNRVCTYTQIVIWDSVSNSELVLFNHQGSVRSIVWHPDGDRFAFASDYAVHIWDAASGVELSRFENQSSSITWHPNGNWLASAADTGVVIWDVTNGTELIRFEGHQSKIMDIAWHPIKDQLASASLDDTVRIWDIVSGTELYILDSHQDDVYSVAWHPDGDRLASASGDHTIRIWDAVSGEELSILENHQDNVYSVAWHPDGDRLASVSSKGTVLIQNVLVGCDRILSNFTTQEWRDYVSTTIPFNGTCPDK